MSNLSKTLHFFSIALLRFCLRKKAFKTLNFQTFLPLKEPLVATYSETCTLTSRKCVFEPGISISNSSEKIQFLWSHSSVFDLQKPPKNLNFQVFLSLKDRFVASFNERHAPTSRKNVPVPEQEFQINQRYFNVFGHIAPFLP